MIPIISAYSKNVPTENSKSFLLLSRPNCISQQNPLLYRMSTKTSHKDGTSRAIESAKIWIRKSILFDLYPTSIFPGVLVGPRSRKRLKQGAWVGMSWFMSHSAAQRCSRPQFSPRSCTTIRTGHQDVVLTLFNSFGYIKRPSPCIHYRRSL